MVFGILGCVEVTGPRGRAALAGGRHRSLVAALALRPGVVVPSWRLVEALWGDSPPRTAVRSLHSHVARLRLVLDNCGLGGVVQTRDPGYLLAVEPETVDACRFAHEVRRIKDELAAGKVDGAAEALAQALGLWRGAALADAEPAGWVATEVARLESLRAAAMADRCETLLVRGEYGEALAEAKRLIDDDPLRERPVGLYMIALWGCGQHAEAFGTYHSFRQTLAEELGVDPSPELAQMHAAMLRGVVPTELRPPGNAITASAPRETAACPRLLPPPAGYFTGRAADLDTLDGIAAQPGVVALICGHGGIGKTSLAVQWAHTRRDSFPDGQVFVDARGHDRATALSPHELIGLLIGCLGVPADRISDSIHERIALYRSLLTGKRMLIVIDNAGGTEQIGPAVPSTATTLLLVTSRNNLAALVTHVEVRQIVLGVLSEGESTELFRKVLGAQRVDSEPQATARLAALCGNLPLALRIAAAKLVTHPNRAIETLAGEMSGDDRLALLEVEEGTRTVEAVFTTAYQALSPAAQQLFRRLGQHPGPHFSAALAQAMSGHARMTRALDELVTAHLVCPHAPGRYRFHDLIRLFAQGRADTGERTEVIDLLVQWYLATTHAANETLEPSQNRIGIHPPPGFEVASTSRDKTLELLEEERDNLRALVRHFAGHDRERAACELTYLLSSFYRARGHWSERIGMCEQAVHAARRLGEATIEAEMHRALGVAYRAAYRLHEALESHLRALDLMRGLGDESGLAYVYNNIGGAHVELRRFGEAVDAYQESLRLHTSTGNTFGAVAAERNLGYAYVRMGAIERSLIHLERALAASRVIGYQRLEAATLDSLGEAYLHVEEYDLARERFTDAVRVSQAIGERRYEMDALINLGRIHLARGEPLAALELLGQAQALGTRLGHRHAQARILNLLGDTHLRLGRHDAAGRCLDASARQRAGVPDMYEEANLQRSLGDLAQATGRDEDAKDHRQRAVDLFRKANAPEEAERVAEQIMASGLSRAAG